ncbi:TM2 domain-containing protein [Nostoc sp. 'Lobaria pulmonaria (5183) cyanobiont']|uniref:TM2 domain-containing protein n=1 Tax=Nostoc sp. 'Lobaria pulmonaria (5183) cyanobiont' TaxID=1618022 RepID=UPI000CF312C8|nr:NINE protein [Nostoc sp. 'Lobaria pulmonaria (5183) cyanobiont']AVH70614.1 TM2 domain-containing protein [Nostoc sp. 'Lobaria pulmonaria (5183) cyanobiont']
MNLENNQQQKDRLLVSYILCAVGFIGVGGLHRFYNGRIVTGLFWLLTGGVFGIGQFVDLFFIPNIVDEYQHNLRLKAGVSPFGVPLNQAVVASQVHRPTGNQLMVKLIEAAESKDGILTVTQGVKFTGASFAEVEATLKEMYKSGYVKIDNDPNTGAVTYHFHEL